MAQLAAIVVTQDEDFKRQVGRMLRSGGVPVGMFEDQRGELSVPPDLALVDIREDAATGMSAIERLRGMFPNLAVFAIAATTDPELILQSMRAGANEFFTWPPAEDAFHGAVRRTAARRETAQASARPPSQTLVFFGAKGGAGTTTIAVNCAIELARLSRRPTVIVDLKSCLGEIALFLGVRPRYTVLDAIENLHRLDREFLKELLVRHKSGLEILAASEQFDRPNAQDAGAVEELFRILSRSHDFVVVDAGNAINSCSLAALYSADRIFLVTNPDVPSVRNAQRLVERVRQLGASAERIQLILNRFVETMMIGPKHIETALGYSIHHMFTSDYKAVSTALNSGVPLALANHTELAAQFDRFTRGIIGAPAEEEAAPAQEQAPRRGRFLGLL